MAESLQGIGVSPGIAVGPAWVLAAPSETQRRAGSPDEERRAFEAHLADCDACRAEVASFRETAASLAYTLPAAAPADEDALRARLLARAARTERAVVPPTASVRGRR